MKKNYIYILIACFTMTLSGCSTDPEDATSKHVYGENETPYLKANTDATVATTMKFPTGRFTAQTINLKNYAEKFHEYMGLTVDEVLTGLSNGSIVFYNINPAKSCWNKTAMTKGTTGWYYNSAGGITSESDGIATIEIDTANKMLVVNMEDKAEVGTSLSLNVGFAVNGTDYDNYVRFNFVITVTDPGRIVVSNTIPAGDYNAFSIEFANYQEAIESCMGMTLKEFSSAVSDPEGPIAMYIVDQKTGEWDKTSVYTANGIGYWMDGEKPCNWGETAKFFIETGDACVNIGRYPGIPSGTVYKIKFVYANKEDNSKFVELIVTATME